MTSSLPEHHARLVTTGMNGEGRSIVTSDADGTTGYQEPFAHAVALWETEHVPVHIGDDYAPELHANFAPSAGLRIFTTAFAPEKDWATDPEVAQDAMASVGLGDTRGDRPAGFHTTATIDIQTVISGEIYLLLDEDEVRLGQGDSVVMNGVPHAWRNRSDDVAVVLAVMIAAEPEAANA